MPYLFGTQLTVSDEIGIDHFVESAIGLGAQAILLAQLGIRLGQYPTAALYALLERQAAFLQLP